MHLLAALVCHTTTALSAPNLRARKVHLDDAWSLTVYEKKDIVMSVETWMATEEESVDPFGGVAWPGAVVAARALRDYGVENKVVCCVGCGTGVEVLAAAALNASSVLALDYSADARSLCEAGAQKANYTFIETRAFDVRRDALPPCDVIVCADVFYSKELAAACGRACGAALRTSKRPALISTDSQRYAGHTDAFLDALSVDFAQFKQTTLANFVGSGLLVEEDQTYDARVDVLTLDFAGADDCVFTTARVLPGGAIGLWSRHRARLGGGAGVEAAALAAALGKDDGLVRVARWRDGRVEAAYRARRAGDRMEVITLPCPPRPPNIMEGIKHGAWGGYRAAIAEATARGADATLLVDAVGRVVDGDRALPLLLGADGVVRYPGPRDGAVASVTLNAVSGELRAAFDVREERLTKEAIRAANEVVLLGSGLGCVAVESVDGVALQRSGELATVLSKALDVAHTSDVLRPSVEHPLLRRLAVGAEVSLGDRAIRRLSAAPSAFYVRNLLRPNDCEALMNMAQAADMEQAQTQTGTAARTLSDVAWLPPPAALTSDVANMFLSPEALERPGGGCEDLQVLRYADGGAYSMHHDGNARALTVLYYLNGVGETWFPLADAPPPQNRKEALDRAARLDPETDGVRTITPAAGDALVFFSLNGDGSNDWSAVHAALPSTGEEWVANHWFRVGGLGEPTPDEAD